jgi:hypothetical protein
MGAHNLKCGGGLRMMGQNGGKHGEDKLKGGGGHRIVGEGGGR